ncbi:hypothetical protein [Mesorhizobium sp. M0578]|uniref:hypothetical protein n=1 Tax=unclassified Mesorhizobium TaxID=325217 RepID=UPI003336E116
MTTIIPSRESRIIGTERYPLRIFGTDGKAIQDAIDHLVAKRMGGEVLIQTEDWLVTGRPGEDDQLEHVLFNPVHILRL